MKKNLGLKIVLLLFICILIIGSLPALSEAQVNANSFVEIKRFPTSKPIVQALWSPHGTKLAGITALYTNGSNEFCVWNYASGEQELFIAEGYFTAICWSPDGLKIATGNNNGTVDIRNAETGDINISFYVPNFNGALSWSPDGHHILSGGAGTGNILIWNTTTGALENIITGHNGGTSYGALVLSVSWSPDGTTFASGSRDNNIIIWDYATSGIIQILSGHDDGVESLSWSPGGTKLISSDSGQTLRMWDISTGEQITSLNAQYYNVNTVDWSKGSDIIAAGSYGHIELWNATSITEFKPIDIFEWPNDGNVATVSWSPDGTKIAVGSAFNDLIIFGNTADITCSANDLSFSNEDLLINDVVTISLDVHNIGVDDANNCVVELYYNTTLIGTYNVNVSSHGSKSISALWDTPQLEGNYSIYVYLDTTSEIIEGNEENNFLRFDVYVDDGDGYYGGADAYPNNPNKWTDSWGNLPLYVIVLLLIIGFSVALFLVRKRWQGNK